MGESLIPGGPWLHEDCEGYQRRVEETMREQTEYVRDLHRERDALQTRVAELTAEVREWWCRACHTVYPGPPQQGFACVQCPRCGGDAGPYTQMKLRDAEARVAALEAENARCLAADVACQEAADARIAELEEVLHDIRERFPILFGDEPIERTHPRTMTPPRPDVARKIDGTIREFHKRKRQEYRAWREDVMNYRFRLSIKTRGLVLDGEAMVRARSRSKAEAVLRATLADPEAWNTPLTITPHPEDAPDAPE